MDTLLLIKGGKNLYAKNYKILKKEIKDNTQVERYICSQIGRISIVKMAIVSKAIYRLSAIPIKLPMAFFKELEQKFLQIVCKLKTP